MTLEGDDCTLYTMALLSLHCGLRFGEIAQLRWSKINLSLRQITILNPKNGSARVVFMTKDLLRVLSVRKRENQYGLLFQNMKGEAFPRIPHSFVQNVQVLGFNDGVTDRLQKVTFHTLRHTCAFWLAEAGVDLLVLKEQLGHKTIAMTLRYSHLSPDKLKLASEVIEQGGAYKHNQRLSLNYACDCQAGNGR